MEINIFSQKKSGMKYRKHYIYIPHHLSQLVQEMSLPNRVVTATKSHSKQSQTLSILMTEKS